MAAQLTEAVADLSVSDSSSPEWSAEELDAFREVKRRLLADGVPEGRLGDREVVLTTMCSKLRPDKAVAKFGDFFGFGCSVLSGSTFDLPLGSPTASLFSMTQKSTYHPNPG